MLCTLIRKDRPFLIRFSEEGEAIKYLWYELREREGNIEYDLCLTTSWEKGDICVIRNPEKYLINYNEQGLVDVIKEVEEHYKAYDSVLYCR